MSIEAEGLSAKLQQILPLCQLPFKLHFVDEEKKIVDLIHRNGDTFSQIIMGKLAEDTATNMQVQGNTKSEIYLNLFQNDDFKRVFARQYDQAD